jgi:hypothetical protein
MLTLTVLACTPDPEGPKPPGPTAVDEYPLDDELTFADLQALGTHNSYHLQTNDLPALAYEHEPLDVQLGEQGVRQFELDVAWGISQGEHLVYHLPLIDQGTTCETFADCAEVLFDWSSAHPTHHPLFVLVETKDAWDDGDGPAHVDALEDELRSVWPDERLIRPADVLREHADLASALAAEGWPTLRELRGRALFVLHDGGERRDWFVAQDLGERALFPDAQGNVDVPWAAVHTMNDPTDPHIPDVVGLHHLVRTRADGDMVEVFANDPAHRDAALASGAHFVSTDAPAPIEGLEYVVTIPGGTPSRCNPVHAPADCASEDIEHP